MRGSLRRYFGFSRERLCASGRATCCTSFCRKYSRTLDYGFGYGEVRVYRGTGVSRGVRRTTWEGSLKIWELEIPYFKEFLWEGNTLGLFPASLPHTLGYAYTLYAPTSPLPMDAPFGISLRGRSERGRRNYATAHSCAKAS